MQQSYQFSSIPAILSLLLEMPLLLYLLLSEPMSVFISIRITAPAPHMFLKLYNSSFPGAGLSKKKILKDIHVIVSKNIK